MKQGVSLPKVLPQDKEHLTKIGLIEKKDDQYIMTAEAKAFCARLDNYFIKARKKTIRTKRGTYQTITNIPDALFSTI